MSGADDFARAPWLYPGTPVDRSDPIDPSVLDVESGDGPVLVVAVGSNASRAVLQRKFARVGIDTTPVFVRVRVTGLRVGFSAHVSTPGYIPAAPVVDPAVTTDLVASLLDAECLAALDATEPNYVRREVSADRFPIELQPANGGAASRPASFSVYASRRGVLRQPGGAALGPQGQEQLFARLAAECADFARLAAGSPRAVMQAFAGSAALRAAGRRAFQAAGWVHRSEPGTAG